MYTASWRIGLEDGDCDHVFESADSIDELNLILESYRGTREDPFKPHTSLKVDVSND